MQLCEWADFDADWADICRRLDAGEVGDPFSLLSLPVAPEALRRWTERYNAHLLPVPALDLRPKAAYRHERIRIAYVSGDFREHPVSHLLVEPLEHHDRDRFEIIAVALDADRDDPMRHRIKAATDRFLVVDGKTDDEAAQLMRDLDVDIAVDLMGYTSSTRLGILARRPAPVQVSFLGFPSTTGAPFIDYIIADPVVVPSGHEAHYSEQVVRLPETYQPNSRRAIAPETPARAELGLPENAFVFCAFNNSYKISPDLFAVWMRLLRAVEGSVLWLNIGHEIARRNLADAARAHGIAPHRLVFAERVSGHAEHLARYRAADLFLDTLYYNAHTTGSDALWAGLPLITCVGATYAARVGASLLAAVGLPELVTTSLADYEALALALARDPERLGAVRARLARAPTTSPLYDPARFTRHLEAAFMTMVRYQRAGTAPTGFDVPAIAD